MRESRRQPPKPRKHTNTTTNYEVHGRWAICNPDSDEPTISPMKKPDDMVTGMTYDEARTIIQELDDCLTRM